MSFYNSHNSPRLVLLVISCKYKRINFTLLYIYGPYIHLGSIFSCKVMSMEIFVSFFSVPPNRCQNNCTCHFDLNWEKAVYTCSGEIYSDLPATVPGQAEWLIFDNTNIKKLCGNYQYLLERETIKSLITYISLQNSNLEHICDQSLHLILKKSNVKWLNLAMNKFHSLPNMLNDTRNKLEKLWLAGNPMKCDCDMLPLIEWLPNFKTLSGDRLVQDYENVLCFGGKFNGIPVYKLDKIMMGCYPYRMATWIIAVSSAIGSILLITVIIVVIIHANWERFRWIVYKNFDKILGDADRNENIAEYQFDAFLSFW